MLFIDCVSLYMEAKKTRVRANTYEGYESAVRCHLLPRWGHRDIESIGEDELQEWVDGFELPGAAEKAFKTFRQVFRWSVRKLRLRIWDVTQGVELPAKPVYRRPHLTAAQERNLLKSVMGEPFEAVCICCAALGLRPSEGAGLDWGDIDWRSGWVLIDRGAHSLKGGGVVEYGCKTKTSHRRLKLPRWALVRLRQIRGHLRSGRLRGDLAPKQLYARLKRAMVRCGLGFASIECLRHSWATIALEAGALIDDIAVSLGHTSTDMCRAHYLMSTNAVVARAQAAYARAMGAD